MVRVAGRFQHRGRGRWVSSYHNGVLLHLDVTGDGTAIGRFAGNISFDPTSGSRAAVTVTPGATEFPIRQCGLRSLWDEATAAYDWWVNAGRPYYDRFGLTVTPAGQQIWLDSPRHLVPTFTRKA